MQLRKKLLNLEEGLNVYSQLLKDEEMLEVAEFLKLRLLEDLHRRYPRALILGHHDLRSPVPPARSKTPIKDCPCFDAAREYAALQPL